MRRTPLLLFLLLAALPIVAQTEEARIAEAQHIAKLTAIDPRTADDADASQAFSHADIYTGSESPENLPWPQNVQARINRLIHLPLLQTTTAAVMVYDLTAGQTIYTYNHRQLLRPASTMKVLTAVTALDVLGGSHRFATSLYYKGTIARRTLQGDLYCVGSMDPKFEGADLNTLVNRLRQLGIDTVRGRIVADCSLKDTLRWGEGWCWDDDNPVLSPLLVDKKSNFTSQLASALRSQGVVLTNTVATQGRLPAGATHVGTCTHTLDDVLVRMMKESDNLYAEAVFYQIAASNGRRPTAARDAATLMAQRVKRMGLTPDEYRFADGSGLSLYNYVSAELQVAFLRYAWDHRKIYEHLLPTLPVAGEDGTLRRRMQGTPAGGNVQAKTGTLTGVSSLTGYCTASNGHRLCFSIINQGVRRAADGRQFQDRVCEALCQ